MVEKLHILDKTGVIQGERLDGVGSGTWQQSGINHMFCWYLIHWLQCFCVLDGRVGS